MRPWRLVVPAIVGIVLFASPEPAAAKLPPRTCELSTTRPLVGQEVLVEVRFWNDPRHTHPARWVNFGRLPDLVEARAISPGAPGDVLGVLRGTVHLVEPGVYEGRLVFPDSRSFHVGWCGGGYDRRGYPAERGVVVRPRTLPARGHDLPVPPTGGGLPVLFGVLALGTAFLVARALTHQRGRRQIGTSG
jgi:hypothetical protein